MTTAEQISTRIGLAENIVNRILAFGLCSLDQRTTKARLFNFFKSNTMPRYMVNPILGPDEFTDPHSVILPPLLAAALLKTQPCLLRTQVSADSRVANAQR
jgi:hypothetical protein